MNSNTYAVLMIAVMAAVTLLLRALPFLVFQDRKTPIYINYLGKYLPFAIMGMLVVYCLKDVPAGTLFSGLKAFAAVALTAGLHIWKKNTLLSIICGTAFYMILMHI